MAYTHVATAEPLMMSTAAISSFPNIMIGLLIFSHLLPFSGFISTYIAPHLGAQHIPARKYQEPSLKEFQLQCHINILAPLYFYPSPSLV
jgi:hypothetical protein